MSAVAVKFNYCPLCGHTLYEDPTVPKRFGVQVMLCPMDHIRLTYVEATDHLLAVKP